ncbi:MAG: YcxB family protein [Planctomycetota bacterium]|jgi:hypothetical protein|nr:YcxB family protein [Planctomycetota bacterium]
MSELVFTLTFGDWLDFTLDCHQRVPSMRRMKTFSHYSIGAVYAIFGGIVIWMQNELVFGISFLLLSAAWIILFPKYHQWRTAKHLQRLLKDGGDAILTEHRLGFNESGIQVKRQGQVSEIAWSSFQDFILTEKAVYLKLGPLQGLIIPRDVCGVDDFVSTCQSNIEST